MRTRGAIATTNASHAPTCTPRVSVASEEQLVNALNDYTRFEWLFLQQRGRWGHYGVIHGANEFLVRYAKDWEVVYYTFGPYDAGGDLGLRRLR